MGICRWRLCCNSAGKKMTKLTLYEDSCITSYRIYLDIQYTIQSNKILCAHWSVYYETYYLYGFYLVSISSVLGELTVTVTVLNPAWLSDNYIDFLLTQWKCVSRKPLANRGFSKLEWLAGILTCNWNTQGNYHPYCMHILYRQAWMRWTDLVTRQRWGGALALAIELAL